MKSHNSGKYIAVLLLACMAALGLFLLGVFANAQAGVGRNSSGGARLAPVTVRGTVEQVLRHACSFSAEKRHIRQSDCAFLSLVLETKNGPLYVSLGPIKFIRDQRFFFVDGDRLWVVGIPGDNHGTATLLTERVIKENRELILRDAAGRPFWFQSQQKGSPAP